MKLESLFAALSLAVGGGMAIAAPVTYTFTGMAAFAEGGTDVRSFELTVTGDTSNVVTGGVAPDDYYLIDSGLSYALTVGGTAYSFDDALLGSINVYNFNAGIAGFGFANIADWLLLSNAALAGYDLAADLAPVGGTLLATSPSPQGSLTLTSGSDTLVLGYDRLSNVSFSVDVRDNGVPEPGSFALAGLALAGLALTRRRRA